MHRTKRLATWVTVVVCAIGLSGVAGAPDASAGYVCGQASACKAISTSNQDASEAVKSAEALYKQGTSLLIERLDGKRRWDVRVWTDFQGEVMDPNYSEGSALPEQRAVVQASSVFIRNVITKVAPPDSVLRSARLEGEDDDSVIVLEFDDLHCAPLATITVDAATGAELVD